MVKKAETPPTMASSLGVLDGVELNAYGRNTVNPKTAMKMFVRALLINVLIWAFLTSCLMSVLRLCGKPAPARSEKMDWKETSL
jgi:hypothetical protein